MKPPLRSLCAAFFLLCACSSSDETSDSNKVGNGVGGSHVAAGLTGSGGGTGSGNPISAGGRLELTGTVASPGGAGGSGNVMRSGGASGIADSARAVSGAGRGAAPAGAAVSGGQPGIGGKSSAGDTSGDTATKGIDGAAAVTISKPVVVGGAAKVTDAAASEGYSVGLASTGQSAQVLGLPAANKLAIRYASVSAGTISVSVNGQTARKVNVHSSGALTGSFLYAIIDISIPANATVTITRASGDFTTAHRERGGSS